MPDTRYGMPGASPGSCLHGPEQFPISPSPWCMNWWWLIIKKPGVINDPLVKGGINPNPGLRCKDRNRKYDSNNFGKIQTYYAAISL